MRGLFKNCNTREALKALDKNALFERVAGDVWAAILDGRAAEAPQEHLNRFLLVSFANLKKYQFHYMSAVPALLSAPITRYTVQRLDQQQEEILNVRYSMRHHWKVLTGFS